MTVPGPSGVKFNAEPISLLVRATAPLRPLKVSTMAGDGAGAGPTFRLIPKSCNDTASVGVSPGVRLNTGGLADCLRSSNAAEPASGIRMATSPEPVRPSAVPAIQTVERRGALKLVKPAVSVVRTTGVRMNDEPLFTTVMTFTCVCAAGEPSGLNK